MTLVNQDVILAPAQPLLLGFKMIFSPPFLHRPDQTNGRFSQNGAFSLIELLTALAIIAILAGISIPVLGTLFRSNQIDQSASTLSGVLEQAREAAISGNTYVWVTFSAPPTGSPASGIWVATFQSQDGTETPINTTATPAWATTVTVPTGNLQMLYKLQKLSGVSIVDTSALAPSVVTAINASNSASPPPTTSISTLFEPAAMQWTVSPLQFAQGYSSTSSFSKALEFTPSGEARSGTTTWYDYIQFALVPSIGTNTNNAILVSISRLTGRTTVYRP